MTIRAGVYQWLAAAFAPNVSVWADQDGDLPIRPYATVKVSSIQRLGVAARVQIADDTVRIQQSALINVQVQIFGGGLGAQTALELMERLRATLDFPSVQESLSVEGLSFLQETMPPTDITAVVGTTFESRAAMDIQFGTNLTADDVVDWFETVQLHGELNDGDIVFDRTITVS